MPQKQKCPITFGNGPGRLFAVTELGDGGPILVVDPVSEYIALVDKSGQIVEIPEKLFFAQATFYPPNYREGMALEDDTLTGDFDIPWVLESEMDSADTQTTGPESLKGEFTEEEFDLCFLVEDGEYTRVYDSETWHMPDHKQRTRDKENGIAGCRVRLSVANDPGYVQVILDTEALKDE